MQETTFPVEILIHDDASTDSTRNIICNYQTKYPKLIKTVIQKENQYSKGRSPTKILRELAKGKFIALCEGDDYWNDSLKLLRQVTALERRDNIMISAHPVTLIRSESGDVAGSSTAFSNESVVIPPNKMFKMNINNFYTCSIVYNKKVHSSEYKYSYLYELNLTGSFFSKAIPALEGGILFLPIIMGSYRIQTPGSDTDRRINNFAFSNKGSYKLTAIY
jgi:glycosyltransferase involved in cell wall biosynthesis